MMNERLLQLIEKYNRPGPRYTSYPMAPEWTADYGPAEYAATLDAMAQRPDEPLSLYVHIPFCKKLCWFCGCNKVISTDPVKAELYLDRVAGEVARVRERLGNRNQVTQMHWGGGTPSILNPEHTRRSFNILAEAFKVQDGAEIAMEIDPRTTSPEKILLLKELGFNRLSFGVQDLDDQVQEAIHRGQTEKETAELYEFCRKEGFEGINFDLVYGLPYQTPEPFEGMIERVIAMRPDRVALYSFAHIPTLLPSQKLLETEVLPDPQTKMDLFLIGRQKFLDGGYVQIGMDHFVLPEDELARAQARRKLRRNFMGYTVRSALDWLGFGVSAISYVGHCFVQNEKNLKSYQDLVGQGKSPIERGLRLNNDDILRQAVIADLMCHFAVDFPEMDRRFEIDSRTYFATEFEELQAMATDNLIRWDDQTLKVTDLGKLFVRNIAMTFDIYLRQTRDSSRAFSKTV